MKENYIDGRQRRCGYLPVNESLSSHATRALDATHEEAEADIETEAETNDDPDFALLHRRVVGGTTYKFMDGGGGNSTPRGCPGLKTRRPSALYSSSPSKRSDRPIHFPLFLCDPVHLHIIELHRVVLSVNRVIVLHTCRVRRIRFPNMGWPEGHLGLSRLSPLSSICPSVRLALSNPFLLVHASFLARNLKWALMKNLVPGSIVFWGPKKDGD